jgi:hypothetical protein
MAEYVAGQSEGTQGLGIIADVQDAAKQRTPGTGAFTGLVIPVTAAHGGEFDDQPSATAVSDFTCDQEWETGVGPQWFEHLHYTPEQIALGNMLTTVTQEVEIYNSYRRTSQTLTSVTNNAGSGITFTGLPTLPTEIEAQEGEVFDVVISTDGPPTINGTIDVVNDVANFSIPITGNRVVMFAYEPERPIVEVLEWKTDILTAADGTEQRIAWRKNPRQNCSMIVRIPEGDDRRKMQNLLKGWHPRVFGVPVWWESRALETDVASTATSIPIDTAYADYRVGGLVIIWSDPDTFDAVEISAVNANSLDLSSQVAHSYTAGEALVMPLRTALLGEQVDMRTFLNNLQEVKLDWRIQDNDVGDSFGDTSPFSTHNSKVMLDGYNVTSREIADGIMRKLEVIDNETGVPVQYSGQLASVPMTQKGFYGGTRQAIWETRQLIHALRGSQTSFYLPTFYEDMVVTQNLVSSSFDLNIKNSGYTDYIDGVEPYTSIWIELDDGTILTREITASQVIDSQNERLTVDTAWASDIDKDDIARVSLLRLVRLADDKLSFTHDLPGSAQINMTVRGAP